MEINGAMTIHSSSYICVYSLFFCITQLKELRLYFVLFFSWITILLKFCECDFLESITINLRIDFYFDFWDCYILGLVFLLLYV